MSEVDETLPVGEKKRRPWARPDCPYCRGYGYYRVVASDTYQPGDTINCGNCYSAAHPDPELSPRAALASTQPKGE